MYEWLGQVEPVSSQPMSNNNNTVTSHNLSFSRQNPSRITSLAWDI